MKVYIDPASLSHGGQASPKHSNQIKKTAIVTTENLEEASNAYSRPSVGSCTAQQRDSDRLRHRIPKSIPVKPGHQSFDDWFHIVYIPRRKQHPAAFCFLMSAAFRFLMFEWIIVAAASSAFFCDSIFALTSLALLA